MIIRLLFLYHTFIEVTSRSTQEKYTGISSWTLRYIVTEKENRLFLWLKVMFESEGKSIERQHFHITTPSRFDFWLKNFDNSITMCLLRNFCCLLISVQAWHWWPSCKFINECVDAKMRANERFSNFPSLGLTSLASNYHDRRTSPNFWNGTFLLVIQFYHCRYHQPLFSWIFLIPNPISCSLLDINKIHDVYSINSLRWGQMSDQGGMTMTKM